MSDDQHKDELISLTNDLMTNKDAKPLHPKNKLILYSRYVLSNYLGTSTWQLID